MKKTDTPDLYHFTDTMRLPRILRSVELRPATYVDAMAGARDFLHATSNPHGEKTAATTMSDPDGKFYRGSFYAKVRFTLDADFEQCMTVVGRYPEWTPKMFKALHDLGHENGSSPHSWYARANPLPLDKLVAVHTMVDPDNCWRPSDWSVAVISTVQGGLDIRGVRIRDRILFSERYVDLDGIAAYRFKPAVSVAIFAQAAE
jgi:hypothetical protein